MLNRVRLEAILALALLVNTFGFTIVSAESPTGLAVEVTIPDQSYTFGSTATAYIHVFLEGEHIDPDRIEVKVGESLHVIPSDRESKGVYRASFVIDEGEMSGESGDYFQVDAHVWKDGEWAAGGSTVTPSDYPYLEVRVFIDDSLDNTPVPGQRAEFTVKTTCLGRYVDPDTGTMSGKAGFDLHAPTSIDLVLVRQSTGIYRGAFEVPSDWQSFWACWISVEATLTSGRFVSEGHGSASMAIHSWDVWYRCAGISDTSASVDIYVQDPAGTPLPDATLSLVSRYTNIDGMEIKNWHNLTCDASGRARLELTYRNVSGYEPETPGVHFDGDVSNNGKSQYVHGYIILSDAPMLKPEDRPQFEVRLLGNPSHGYEHRLPMGVETNLTYIATLDDAPMAGQEIFGRVYGDNGIYWNGSITTDANGSFNVALTTPVNKGPPDWDERLSVLFGTWLNGTIMYGWGVPELVVWSHNHTWQSRAERCPTTYFQVTRASSEREFRLSLFTEGADGIDENAQILWGVNSADEAWNDSGENIKSMDPFWELRSPLPTTWYDGAFRTTLKVPDFIPPDVNLYAIGIVTLHGDIPFETRYAYLSNVSALLVDLPPTVSIGSPVNGSVQRGEVFPSGTAADDHTVRTVMVRIDGGNWTMATGTTSWGIVLGPDSLEEGHHTLEAISYDGLMYSPISRVEFEYAHEVHASEGNWWVLVLIILITIALCGMAVYRSSRSRLVQ